MADRWEQAAEAIELVLKEIEGPPGDWSDKEREEAVYAAVYAYAQHLESATPASSGAEG